MPELEDECDKHPVNLKGLNPKEFAKEFGNTNYFYQQECFKELSEEYKRQSKGDKEKGRNKLFSGLENLSASVYLVIKSIENVCDICKKYMKNPYKKLQ